MGHFFPGNRAHNKLRQWETKPSWHTQKLFHCLHIQAAMKKDWETEDWRCFLYMKSKRPKCQSNMVTLVVKVYLWFQVLSKAFSVKDKLNRQKLVTAGKHNTLPCLEGAMIYWEKTSVNPSPNSSNPQNSLKPFIPYTCLIHMKQSMDYTFEFPKAQLY